MQVRFFFLSIPLVSSSLSLSHIFMNKEKVLFFLYTTRTRGNLPFIILSHPPFLRNSTISLTINQYQVQIPSLLLRKDTRTQKQHTNFQPHTFSVLLLFLITMKFILNVCTYSSPTIPTYIHNFFPSIHKFLHYYTNTNNRD